MQLKPEDSQPLPSRFSNSKIAPPPKQIRTYCWALSSYLFWRYIIPQKTYILSSKNSGQLLHQYFFLIYWIDNYLYEKFYTHSRKEVINNATWYHNPNFPYLRLVFPKKISKCLRLTITISTNYQGSLEGITLVYQLTDELWVPPKWLIMLQKSVSLESWES